MYRHCQPPFSSHRCRGLNRSFHSRLSLLSSFSFSTNQCQCRCSHPASAPVQPGRTTQLQSRGEGGGRRSAWLRRQGRVDSVNSRRRGPRCLIIFAYRERNGDAYACSTEAQLCPQLASERGHGLRKKGDGDCTTWPEPGRGRRPCRHTSHTLRILSYPCPQPSD